MSAAAFLRAIIAAPDDDLPRLVYADFLDEHGDPARAEFIRVQCELAKRPDHDPYFRTLEDREHDLLSEHESVWRGTEPSWAREWEWRRGFVDEVAGGNTLFEYECGSWLTRHPIRVWRCTPDNSFDEPRSSEWRDCAWVPFIQSLILDWPTSLELLGSFLNNADLSRLDSLSVAGSSWLEEVGDLVRFNRLSAQLRSLTCGGRSNFRTQALDSQLDPPDLSEALAKSPLEHLACFDSGLTADGLRTLLTAPFAATLKHLDISDNPIAPDAYLAFEQAHRSLRLDKLDVSGTPLAGISLPHLLLAQSLEDLTRLEMNGCGSAMRNMAAVAHSPFWTQAVELRAHSGTIPASTFEPLARSPGPPALRLLDLADNYLRTEGVRMLCDAPWAGSLTWLALSANYLDDEACEVLAESGRFTSLRTLHLAHNNVRQEGGEGEQITDRGVRALAAHPSLANLRLLSLSNTGITHRGVEAAVNAPHWRLFGLGVAGCELSPEVVRTLAESPRLARFVWLDLADNPRLRGDALRPLAESPYLSRMCELDCGGIDVAPDVQHLFRERLGPRFSH